MGPEEDRDMLTRGEYDRVIEGLVSLIGEARESAMEELLMDPDFIDCLSLTAWHARGSFGDTWIRRFIQEYVRYASRLLQTSALRNVDGDSFLRHHLGEPYLAAMRRLVPSNRPRTLIVPIKNPIRIEGILVKHLAYTPGVILRGWEEQSCPLDFVKRANLRLPPVWVPAREFRTGKECPVPTLVNLSVESLFARAVVTATPALVTVESAIGIVSKLTRTVVPICGAQAYVACPVPLTPVIQTALAQATGYDDPLCVALLEPLVGQRSPHGPLGRWRVGETAKLLGWVWVPRGTLWQDFWWAVGQAQFQQNRLLGYTVNPRMPTLVSPASELTYSARLGVSILGLPVLFSPHGIGLWSGHLRGLDYKSFRMTGHGTAESWKPAEVVYAIPGLRLSNARPLDSSRVLRALCDHLELTETRVANRVLDFLPAEGGGYGALECLVVPLSFVPTLFACLPWEFGMAMAEIQVDLISVIRSFGRHVPDDADLDHRRWAVVSWTRVGQVMVLPGNGGRVILGAAPVPRETRIVNGRRVASPYHRPALFLRGGPMHSYVAVPGTILVVSERGAVVFARGPVPVMGPSARPPGPLPPAAFTHLAAHVGKTAMTATAGVTTARVMAPPYPREPRLEVVHAGWRLTPMAAHPWSSLLPFSEHGQGTPISQDLPVPVEGVGALTETLTTAERWPWSVRYCREQSYWYRTIGQPSLLATDDLDEMAEAIPELIHEIVESGESVHNPQLYHVYIPIQ